MRYKRAVEKLRILADGCQDVARRLPGDRFVLEAYTFGDVLAGADPLEVVDVVLVLNLTPDEVPWESDPPGTAWLADWLRLTKGGYRYFWRSYLDPVWNHFIREPVRFWSIEKGPDETVLDALAGRRFGELSRLVPAPDVAREQVAAELDTALARLRTDVRSYWDRDWRRKHTDHELGRSPETELWRAVSAYLDLRDELLGTADSGQGSGQD